MTHLFRDIAAHKPGTITRVGWEPSSIPGLTEETKRKNIQGRQGTIDLIELNGQEYLLYKAFPINVAIIRGTTADTDGNITMEKEALTQEARPLPWRLKNSNGFVIVQVERIADRGTLNAGW